MNYITTIFNKLGFNMCINIASSYYRKRSDPDLIPSHAYLLNFLGAIFFGVGLFLQNSFSIIIFGGGFFVMFTCQILLLSRYSFNFIRRSNLYDGNRTDQQNIELRQFLTIVHTLLFIGCLLELISTRIF